MLLFLVVVGEESSELEVVGREDVDELARVLERRSVSRGA
jgi:hypothetical protein